MRENGFYRIRLTDELVVGEWSDDRFYVCGMEEGFGESEVQAVGPRIVMPDDLAASPADAELIAALRKRPYDRAAREAADRLEELTGQHLL